MLEKVAVIALSSLVFGVANCLQVCPPASLVSPCRCDPSNRTLTCDGIENPQEMERVFERVPSISLNELIVRNCLMLYIPSSVLEGSKFDSVTLDGCYLQSLFDAIPSAEGRLSKLVVDRVQAMQGLEWKFLSKLKLRDLIVKDTSVPAIDDSFGKELKARDLESLWMEKTKTERIAERAFEGFVRMRTFALTRTAVKKVARDMFPKPWSSISWINLGYNQLKNLPVDIFDDMPYLNIVLLEKNFLTTIPETATRSDSKIAYQLTGNPIHCDCSMKWMVQSGKGQVMGECMEPAEWRGRDFFLLEPGDFAYCGR